MKAFWHYYITVNIFNLVASVIAAMAYGILYFPIIFTTVGTVIGLFCYYYFYKEQYYFYYNLGLTRKKLVTTLFILNAVIAATLLLIIYLTSLCQN